MTLYIWTNSDAMTIRTVMGPIISRQSVSHQIIPFPDNINDVFPVPTCGPGDVLLACGTRALTALAELGVFEKKHKTVGSNRGRAHRWGHGHVFMTYDPSMVNVDYARFPDIQWDTQLAIRQHDFQDVKPQTGEYLWVESLDQVIAEVDRRYALTGKKVYMACDTETMGLNEYDDKARIISISFTLDAGKSYMLYFEEGETLIPIGSGFAWEEPSYWQSLWEQVHWLLTTDKIALEGANWKYDSRWINRKWAINCTNFRFDTLLVGTLLNENISNSLKMHAKIYTTMGGYEDDMDKHDMAHLEAVSKEELGQYMGGDTDATHRVAAIMRQDLLRDRPLVNFYSKLLHPSSSVFEKMERNGVLVDAPYMESLERELEAEQFRLEKEMRDLCPRKLMAKYQDNFSFTRPVIIRDLFFSGMGYNLKPKMLTEKSGEPSTAVDHLLMFGDAPEAQAFVSKLSELNSANKTLSTYVRGFMKHLRSDGRYHSSYMLFKGGYGDKDNDSGADTGRTSAKDPAMQCQIGGSLIYTNAGNQTLLSMVEGFEKGRRYRVLTHTGSWRDVVGVYRNGVKPVFKVSFRNGYVVYSTGNHPLLSSSGFLRTDKSTVGDRVFFLKGWHAHSKVQFAGDGIREIESLAVRSISEKVAMPVSVRSSESGVGSDASQWKNWVLRMLESRASDSAWKGQQIQPVQNLQCMGQDDWKMHKPEQQRLYSLWGSRDSSLRKVEKLREFSSGYGGSAHGQIARSLSRHERQLRAQELPLGDSYGAISQYQTRPLDRAQRGSPMSLRLGLAGGIESRNTQSPIIERVEHDSGPQHAQEALKAGFCLSEIDCIEYIGTHETYDLTIDSCHSFIANGVVVHNTLPKHTKWAKKLRRALIAPPGKTILQLDYSQGELKIAACLANEPTMLAAYLNGVDLHAITAAKMSGYLFEDFLLLPEDVFDELRSRGKAGNFGLCYGMGAEGFQAYALNSYGVKMSLLECETARDAFFELYKGLLPWHDKYKNIARRYGEVRSPLGRVRHLPLINSRDRQAASKAGRNAVNSPVQATLSDMMQLAMIFIDREYGDKVEMMMMTHDSIGLYVPMEEATIWGKRLKDILDNLPLKAMFGWDHQLPFTSDVEIAVPDLKDNLPKGLGDGVVSLASLKKVKVFS